MRMTFKIEMDRPIIRGTHYISPGGYCLRFWMGKGKCKDIDFDFMDYTGTIVDEKYLECCVDTLDTESFVDSAHLLQFLKNRPHDWVEFFVYTGESDEAEIKPVKVTNIVIQTSNERFKLKDYVFTESEEIALPSNQFSIVSSIMERPIKFCKSNSAMAKECHFKFYERNGRIYLCSGEGVGYYYDIRTGVTGSIYCSGGVEAAKGIIMDTLNKLSRSINFSVKSISVLCENPTGCFYSKSTEEEGTYDIVLR